MTASWQKTDKRWKVDWKKKTIVYSNCFILCACNLPVINSFQKKIMYNFFIYLLTKFYAKQKEQNSRQHKRILRTTYASCACILLREILNDLKLTVECPNKIRSQTRTFSLLTTKPNQFKINTSCLLCFSSLLCIDGGNKCIQVARVFHVIQK